MEGCNISSECGNGIVVNVGDLVVTHCCIHDCGRSGIDVQNGSKATVKDSVISSNADNGLHIHFNGNATVENNDIYASGAAGVNVSDAEVWLRGNSVRDGKGEGVKINSVNHPKLNTVSGQRWSANLDDNVITNNDLAGVAIDSCPPNNYDGYPVATHGGQRTGWSSVLLKKNVITGNGHCSVQRAEGDLEKWDNADSAAYCSDCGFPGVWGRESSTSVGSTAASLGIDVNTIEGNGKHHGSGEQVLFVPVD